MDKDKKYPSITNIQDALAVMASFDPGCDLRAEHDVIYGSEKPVPDSYGGERMAEYGWHYEEGIGWFKLL